MASRKQGHFPDIKKMVRAVAVARGVILAQPAREMGEEKLSQAVTEIKARFCHNLWQKYRAAMRSFSWMSVKLAKGAA
jgi:hypothetical protein